MTTSIRITRSNLGAPVPAPGLPGAFGVTTRSVEEVEEVVLEASNKADLMDVAKAATLAFAASHGVLAAPEEIVPGGWADEAIQFMDAHTSGTPIPDPDPEYGEGWTPADPAVARCPRGCCDVAPDTEKQEG